MQPKIKHQQGFLFIVAVILIVIVGVIGSSIAYMYIGSSKSNTNVLMSNDAFYVATSGLEIAKRDVIAKSVSCDKITDEAKYTDAEFPPGSASPTGYFTVTGERIKAKDHLRADINASVTTIPLVDVSEFLSPFGIVLIGDEFISYTGIQGNDLQNANRGILGTTATTHAINKPVKQLECVLTSTGKVPTATNPSGERVVQEHLVMGDGYLAKGKSLPGGILPVIVVGNNTPQSCAVGATAFKKTTITNNILDYVGCAIASPGGVSVSDNALVQCAPPGGSSGAGDTVWSNNYNSPAPSIDTNPDDFYSYFFSKSIEEFKDEGYQALTKANFNDVLNPAIPEAYGKNVVWYDGDLVLDGDEILSNAPSVKTLVVLGDIKDLGNSKPSTLGNLDVGPLKILVTGKVDVKKGTIFNGFVYMGQTADTVVLAEENLIFNGGVASAGKVDIKDGTKITLTETMSEALSDDSVSPGLSVPEVFS